MSASKRTAWSLNDSNILVTEAKSSTRAIMEILIITEVSTVILVRPGITIEEIIEAVCEAIDQEVIKDEMTQENTGNKHELSEKQIKSANMSTNDGSRELKKLYLNS